MRRIILLLSLFILVPVSLVSAEKSVAPLRYRHFNNFDDKTISMSVRCVTQDSKGMIWLGTTNGLCSFDGYMVKRHSSEILDGIIQCLTLVEDKLYVGGENGLFVYDLNTHETTKETDIKDISAVCSIGDKIWLGSTDGLFLYTISTGLLSKIEPDKATLSQILSLAVVGNNIYIGTLFGLGYYSLSESAYHLLSDQEAVVSSLLLSMDGEQLMFGTGGHLKSYNLRTRTIKRLLELPTVKSMEYDQQGNLLLGTDNGLFIYTASGILAQSSHDARNKHSLPGEAVWDICKDAKGNILFATDNGISISTDDNGIKELPLSAITQTGLGNQIYCIDKTHDGPLWIGGNRGALCLDDTARDMTRYRWYQMNDRSSYIPHNRVRRIFHDKDGTTWLATDMGLLRYNESTEIFSHYTITDNSYWLYDIAEDAQNNLWVASYSGIHCLGNPCGQPASSIMPILSFKESDGLSSNKAQRLVFDKAGRLWVLANHELNKIDPDSRVIEKIRLEGNNGEKYSPSVMTTDLNGNLWISDGKFVTKISGSSKEDLVFETISLRQSSDKEEALAITCTDNGIWMTTSGSIYVINDQTMQLHRYSVDQWLTAIYYDSESKKIWFGANDKILEIDLETEYTFPNKQLTITDIKVDPGHELSDSWCTDGIVNLPHDCNSLEVFFSDFNYESIKLSNLYFKVDNAIPQWTKLSPSQNSIFLSNLSPGIYKLYLCAEDTLSAAGPVLTINITSPWYTSTFAKISYILLTFLAVWGALRFIRIRRDLRIERAERQHLVEQGQAKMKFFTNVAHEFKTPLNIVLTSLSRLPYRHMSANEKEMIDQAQNNTARLNSLLQLMLETYREDGDIPQLPVPHRIEVTSLANDILLQCQEQYTDACLNFSFHCPQSPIYAFADVYMLESIINNLLSNACKYSFHGGNIVLSLEVQGEVLKIEVADNGIGIPKKDLPNIFKRYFRTETASDFDKHGTGIGLATVKDYVEMHHGSIVVKSDNNGTVFCVNMPVLDQAPFTAGSFVDTHKAEDETANETTGSDVVQTDKMFDTRKVVVIIDDNVSTVNFITDLLQQDYRCLCAHDGKAGLRLCLEEHPDLIITDYMMPVMDGLKMCKEIRAHNSLSTIPIIMLTGRNESNTELKSLMLNIDAFFVKPFDHTLLLAKVFQLLSSKSKMREQVRIESITVNDEKECISSDEQFLRNVTKIIETEISNPDLTVTFLTQKCGMGEKQLYRKIKLLTDLSTSEYIRSIRLKKASGLFQSTGLTVSEVMYRVGFSNASYFTRCFKKEFGCTPMEYTNRYRKK